LRTRAAAASTRASAGLAEAFFAVDLARELDAVDVERFV
jgi:hypothetical protein